MSEEITITKEDLVLWLDRPPSNDDLDLCEYLANAVQNRQKYYEKNQHLKENNKSIMEELLRVVGLYNQQKSVLDEIRDNLQNSIDSINDKLSDKEIRVENGIIVNPINDYRIVRLKAIRMKCKELLQISNKVN